MNEDLRKNCNGLSDIYGHQDFFGYFRKYEYYVISIRMTIIGLVLKIPVELPTVLSIISRNVYLFSTSSEPTAYLDCLLLSNSTLCISVGQALPPMKCNVATCRICCYKYALCFE